MGLSIMITDRSEEVEEVGRVEREGKMKKTQRTAKQA
jgi:hypothetical protein